MKVHKSMIFFALAIATVSFLTSCGGDGPSSSAPQNLSSIIQPPQYQSSALSGPVSLQIMPLVAQSQPGGAVRAFYIFYYAGNNLVAGTLNPNIPYQPNYPTTGVLSTTMINDVESVTYASNDPKQNLVEVPVLSGRLTQSEVSSIDQVFKSSGNVLSNSNSPNLALLPALVNNAYFIQVLTTQWKAGTYVLNFLVQGSDGSTATEQETLQVK